MIARTIEMPTPTGAQWSAYSQMFDYFNAELFFGLLPACILNFSRKANSYGFFAADRWEETAGDLHHEISLNPATLKGRKPIEIASTLVHEMVHLWQKENGSPGRRGYHNKEWAEEMKQIGLMPSSTGRPGGSETGARVSHYVIPCGRFEVAFEKMPIELPYLASDPPKPLAKPREDKVKFTCPACKANAWGKGTLKLTCAACSCSMTRDGLPSVAPNFGAAADFLEQRLAARNAALEAEAAA